MKTDNHLQLNTVFPQAYNNSSRKKVLEFVSTSEIKLDLPFINTQNKRLKLNMLYLKIENNLSDNDITTIRLLNFEVIDDIIQLLVQELETKRTYTLEWNMEYDGNYWLWRLADFEILNYLFNETCCRS